MKQTEILDLLKVVSNEGTRGHAGKLAQILALLKAEKNNITDVHVFECSMLFGRMLRRSYRYNVITEKRGQTIDSVQFDGERKAAKHIEITLQNGNYSITVPAEIYSAFAKVLDLQHEGESNQAKEVLHTYSIPAEILPALHKAIKFVSTNDLRPVMQHVCIDVLNNKVQVVATDAHQMYMSKTFAAVAGGFIPEANQVSKLMIPVKAIKQLPKKATGPIELQILAEDHICIAGQTIKTFTGGRFPDWRCVVPEYSESVLFDRVKMINKTKQVVVHANKSTSQVNYHINGKIEMSAQDVDFSFEATEDLPYISKTIPDTDIAFNAKLLVNVLSTFKADSVHMMSAGLSTKAAIFTDGIDQVLLMPLQLND